MNFQLKLGKKGQTKKANTTSSGLFAPATEEEEKPAPPINPVLYNYQRNQERYAEEQRKLEEEDPNIYKYDDLFENDHPPDENQQEKKGSSRNTSLTPNPATTTSASSGIQERSSEIAVISGKPNSDSKPKEARYMEKIMRVAKERQIEREIMKDQAERKKTERETEQLGVAAEQKFTTSSYLKKQEERKKWLEMDAEREQRNKRQAEQSLGVSAIHSSIISTMTGERTPDKTIKTEKTKKDLSSTQSSLPSNSDEQDKADSKQTPLESLNDEDTKKQRLKEFLETRIVPHESDEAREQRLSLEKQKHIQMEKRRKEEDEKLLEKFSKRSTEKTIDDARTRYLQRKKQQELQKLQEQDQQ